MAHNNTELSLPWSLITSEIIPITPALASWPLSDGTTIPCVIKLEDMVTYNQLSWQRMLHSHTTASPHAPGSLAYVSQWHHMILLIPLSTLALMQRWDSDYSTIWKLTKVGALVTRSDFVIEKLGFYGSPMEAMFMPSMVYLHLVRRPTYFLLWHKPGVLIHMTGSGDLVIQFPWQ